MKSVTFGRLLAIISLGLSGCVFQANAKEYYKWVDAKGVTTYSATPPPSQKQDPQLDPAKKNVNTVTATPIATSTHISSTSVAKDPKNTAIPNPQMTKSATGHTAAPNTTITASTDTLFAVKNCNGVRCWDAKGKPYNLVAGTTYLSATGGKCQKLGNNMRCSK